MSDHPQRPEIRLLDGRFYAEDPQPHFAWMRDVAPVYWDEAGGVWGVARHADVMRVSKNHQTFCSRFSSRPDAPAIPSMINLDDPEHKRRRNLVNKGFTPRAVAAREPAIRRTCVELIERARQRGRFDFVKEVAAPLPMIVIGDMLGVAAQDREQLLRWSDDLILGTSASAGPEALGNAARAFEEYSRYHRRVVADRRSRPLRDDLISVLVHAEVDGEGLDDDALLHESLLILVGGDETTRHVISGGMHALLCHADARRELCSSSNPAGIARAVEEMLRWVSPIQNMNRTAARDTTLAGQRIRKGDKLLLLYPSANRDERVFEEPDRFDPKRDPNEHVAFGGRGTHFCLGASLARLELRVVFEELLKGMPDLCLVDDEVLPRRPSNFIVGIESMTVECR